MSTASRHARPFASGSFHGAACLQGPPSPLAGPYSSPAESRRVVWVARASFPRHWALGGARLSATAPLLLWVFVIPLVERLLQPCLGPPDRGGGGFRPRPPR